MSRDVSFLSKYLPTPQTSSFGGKGQNWISDHLFTSYFGSPPRFFFLVQTGKKQGVPENRNKGNLSTHSCSISTCPRSNQTSPSCLSPYPLHNLFNLLLWPSASS